MRKMNDSIADALALPTARTAQSASGSAADRIYDKLHQRIISLDLPPNTVLSRAEIARQYDVSQTPLREALQRLESEGLVDIHPQSRTMVSRIAADDIYEAHFLRVSVESEVLRRLAMNCPPAVLTRARTILAMQEALAPNLSELPAFQELDELFHQTLMAGVGYPGLHTLLRSRSGHLNRVRRLDLPGEGKIKRILQGHRDIIEALEAGDPDAAVAAIREHLSQTVSRVGALRERFPDHFTV